MYSVTVYLVETCAIVEIWDSLSIIVQYVFNNHCLTINHRNWAVFTLTGGEGYLYVLKV